MITKFRIFSAEDALVYYTDCAIESYEYAVMVKRVPKSERARLRSVARAMIMHVKRFCPSDEYDDSFEYLEARMEGVEADDPDIKENP